MENLLRRSTALFLSLCIVFQSISCAWAPYMEYDMLFDRNFIFDKGLKTTSYNAWFYNEELYNEDNIKKQNAISWVDYLENVYTSNDIEKFIYRPSSNFTDKTKELKKLRFRRILDLNIAQKETNFIDFIEFALTVEKLIADNAEDPWEQEKKEINLADFQPFIDDATAKIQISTDSFIKERYAFQLMKLYRYSKQFKKIESVFKNYFGTSNSMISFWAMEHYAGVIAEKGDIHMANYYFVKVYLHCPSKRASSYLSMKINSEDDFKKTLALCVTNEEKMALHYIRAMRTKALALEDLNAITETLGNHEYARIIMTHEINKLEKTLLRSSDSYYGEDEEKEENVLLNKQLQTYVKELITFNKKLLPKDENDRFWHLSLAYLYYLDHQHSQCSSILDQIKPSTPNIQKQYDIIYIINYLDTKETLTEIDENIIGNKLFALNKNNPSYPNLNQTYEESDYTNESFLIEEYNTINAFIFSKIKTRYETKNAFIELIFSGSTLHSDLYMESSPIIDPNTKKHYVVNVDYLNMLLEAIKKTPGTKLSLFASSYYFNDLSSYEYGILPERDLDYCEQILKEFKATLLMRDPNRLSEAIALFKELPDEFLPANRIYGDPFEFHLINPDFDEYSDHYYNYPMMTKYDFAELLLELNRQKYSAYEYYKLGLAYYNSSYYGVQWRAMAYYRRTYEPNGNFNMEVSEKFFKKALELGELDKETQAEIYFMLARCEQNRYSQEEGEIPDDYEYDGKITYSFTNYMKSMNNSGFQSNFKILEKKYKDTEIYKDIVRDCKYFEYYVN